MKCPNCGKSIFPMKVWLISKWSFVKCNACGKEWGRNLCLQGWIISALLMIPIFFLPRLLVNPLFYLWWVIVMFIDAFTIKLIPKEKVKK
ncbi:MAG: hypothetical protein ABH954_05940 [Candidatus Omnitrophota bacterium]